MIRLYLDFETYSELDIKKVGMYKYIAHESFHPWCMAYAFDDDEIELWTVDEMLPDCVAEAFEGDVLKYAQNAEFEIAVVRKWWPNLSGNLRHWIDVMALAATYGYPLKLNDYCKALGISSPKSANSTRLINKCCVPQKKTAFNPTGKWTPETASDDFIQLYDYCVDDVECMRQAVKYLPKEELSKYEQRIWRHTVAQNTWGLPIDTFTVKNIIHILTKHKSALENELQIATGGNVQTGKQTAKMKEFLHQRGVMIPNLQAATVEEYLNAGVPSLPKKVLELRQNLAHSSTAKFEKMIYMTAADNRMRGQMVYYGAHTGRYAGRGVQPHNLPRAQFNEPMEVINLFNAGYSAVQKEYPNINEAASKLVRPMIMAEAGKKFVVVDYKSIENVLLHWAAGDEKTTQDFKDGIDQYKRFASKRFDVPYKDVSPEQRQMSKFSVLGLGYGGGALALIGIAAGFGVVLSYKQAEKEKEFYRKIYKKIPEFWRNVFAKARRAIETKDPQFLIMPYMELEFRYAGGYLFILLPSGRRLTYPQVMLDSVWNIKVKSKEVWLSGEISYMGVKNNQWMRIGTHPGMMVENIIQAMARDILVYGMLCAEEAGYKVLMSVHDEIVTEVPDNSVYSAEELCAYACMCEEWAASIPLSAEGYEAKRYRKG